MPLNIGDAVLTFLGDSSQLDQAIDKVNSTAQTKLKPAAEAATGVGKAMGDAGKEGAKAGETISDAWMRVARATRENQEAQQQLTAALKSVKSSGGEDVTTMLQLATAQERAAKAAAELAAAQREATGAGKKDVVNMRERRESLAAIGELSGTTIPRGLRTWIAELPILGAAMEAAFSGFAILLLIDVLANGLEKLKDWSEAAEKLREDWTQQDSEFRATSHSIQEEIDAQAQKFIQLTQGPIAAYEFALHHLHSTFDQTVVESGNKLDGLAQKFSDRGGFWKSIFGREDSSNAEKVGKDLKEFSALMQETMKNVQDANKDNPFAGMDAGLDTLKKKIADVGEQARQERIKIAEVNERSSNRGADTSASLMGYDVASFEREKTVLNMMQEFLQMARDREDKSRKAQTQQIKSDEIAAADSITQAKLDADKEFNLAHLALVTERNRMEFERGKETLDQYLATLRKEENDSYAINKKGLDDKLELLNHDPTRNAAEINRVNGQIKSLEQEHQLALLKIAEEGYRQHANQATKALQLVVSSTKEGTQARIDAEKALLEYLKKTWGEQSDAYLAQKQRVAQAELAAQEVRKKLILEQAHFEEQELQQRTSGELAYYQYLRSIAAISQAQLINMQARMAEEIYQSKKKTLEVELTQLGPQEVVARKKVMDQLVLLEQQHEIEKRMLYAQTSNIIQSSYDQLGIKSSMQLMRERDQAKQAYDAIAKSGTATYKQILEAQIKVLQAQIALNASMGKDVTKDTEALNKLLATYHKWEIAIGHINTLGKLQSTILKSLGVDVQLLGTTMQNVALGATAALSKMFETWAQGGVTVAQACEQMTAAILQSIAQYAFAKAIEQMALGFAAMSPTSPDFGHSGEHFTSAALWFVVGAATSVAGGAISNASHGGSSGGGGSTGSGSASTAINSPSDPNPVQSVNVQRFAAGGLITGPTLAVLGDTAMGGRAKEAAVPLDDPKAMKAVGESIGPYVNGSGGDVHIHVQGLISPDNLTKVMRQINRKVSKGQGNLLASNSLRVTKRSV